MKSAFPPHIIKPAQANGPTKYLPVKQQQPAMGKTPPDSPVKESVNAAENAQAARKARVSGMVAALKSRPQNVG